MEVYSVLISCSLSELVIHTHGPFYRCPNAPRARLVAPPSRSKQFVQVFSNRKVATLVHALRYSRSASHGGTMQSSVSCYKVTIVTIKVDGEGVKKDKSFVYIQQSYQASNL